MVVLSGTMRMTDADSVRYLWFVSIIVIVDSMWRVCLVSCVSTCVVLLVLMGPLKILLLSIILALVLSMTVFGMFVIVSSLVFVPLCVMCCMQLLGGLFGSCILGMVILRILKLMLTRCRSLRWCGDRDVRNSTGKGQCER